MTELGLVISFISMLATIAIAVTACAQLPAMLKAQKQRATLDACDRYDIEPMIVYAHRIMRAYYNYNEDVDKNKLHNSVITILNYFDSIALGIDQGLYIKKIVKAHLSQIIIDHIEWAMDEKREHHLARSDMDDSHNYLMKIYDDWKKHP